MSILRALLFVLLLIPACSRTPPSTAETAPTPTPTASEARDDDKKPFDDYDNPMWGLYEATEVNDPKTACKELIGDRNPCVCSHQGEYVEGYDCACPTRGPLHLSICRRGRDGEDYGTPVFAIFEYEDTWYSMPLARASQEHEVGTGLGFSDSVYDFAVEQVEEHSALVSIHYALETQDEICIEEDGQELCGAQTKFTCSGRAVAVIGLGASPPRMLAIEDQTWKCTPGEEVSAREAAASNFGEYFRLPTIERKLRLADAGRVLLVDGEEVELGKELYIFKRRPHAEYRHFLEYGESGSDVDF